MSGQQKTGEGEPASHNEPSTPLVIPWGVAIEGLQHKGEVVIAGIWSQALERSSGAEDVEFRIIILETPHAFQPDSIADPRVLVWTPSEPVAQETSAYKEGASDELPTRLSTLLRSEPLARGAIYTNAGQPVFSTRNLSAGNLKSSLDWLSSFVMINAAQEYLRPLVEMEKSIAAMPQPTQWLSKLKSRVQETRSALNRLSKQLSSPLGDEEERALDHLSNVTKHVDPANFGSAARKTYQSPSEFTADMETYHRLSELADLESDISFVHSYLEEVSLGNKYEELKVDVRSTKEQLQLNELSPRPHLWNSAKDMFRRFKSQYVPLYVKHHRDYYRETTRLYDTLKHSQPQIVALEKLNNLAELGSQVSVDVANRYRDILSHLKPCSIDEITEYTLQMRPTCGSCGLALSAIPPTKEVTDYLTQLRNGLEDQCRRISLAASRRALVEIPQKKLKQLIEVSNGRDLTSLVNVLDDESVYLLRELLREPVS